MIAAPLRPPFKAVARELKSYSDNFWAGPWQEIQFFARIGAMSREKSSGADHSDAPPSSISAAQLFSHILPTVKLRYHAMHAIGEIDCSNPILRNEPNEPNSCRYIALGHEKQEL